MSTIRLIYQCLFSPRLYKLYGDGRNEGLYDPGHLEKLGDQIINTVYFFWNVGIYTSPAIATILYKKGYLMWDGAITVAKCMTGVGIVLAFSYFIRGIGRASTPQYVEFLKILNAAKKDLNKNTKRALSQYDFDFSGWPVEFRWNSVENDEKKLRSYIERPSYRRSTFELVFAAPCSIVTYFVANSFGLKLLYPGSMSIWNYMFFPVLLQGRVKLVTEYNGDRHKLLTRDGNEIDTMFVDQRNKQRNGHILVICSEGNAGFYEIGVMTTPIECGYSVLGWNHPGFAGSTGSPFPSQELSGMDCVMQFAIHHLKFLPENIILFGWSIGGFPTTWAAMNYPDVKGVILDATFDDVMPLAVARMPTLLEPIIRRTIRDYMNLNNQEQLIKYPGPVRIIRRTEDDVICTEEKLSSNRGNYLLIKLLRYRYPYIIDEPRTIILTEWLSADTAQQSRLWNKFEVDENLCMSTLVSFIQEHSNSFPMKLGESMDDDLKSQMCLFLASKYLTDFKAGHCSPLPANLFLIPWNITIN